MVDNNNDFDFAATDSTSVACWLKYTGAFNDLPIIGNAVNSTYQKGWVLSEDGGKFEWTAVGVDVGSIIADPVGGPLINDGTWHHVAVVFDRDAQVATSYVDGQLVDSRSIAALGTIYTGNPVTIGQDPTGIYPSATSPTFSGTFNLDDLGVWKRALGRFEVESIYSAAQNGNQSFDTYGPVTLAAVRSGAQIMLVWQAGTLESTSQFKGAQTVWTPVTGASAPSYTVPANTPAQFYRIHL